jgi:hypothetical protein
MKRKEKGVGREGEKVDGSKRSADVSWRSPAFRVRQRSPRPPGEVTPHSPSYLGHPLPSVRAEDFETLRAGGAELGFNSAALRRISYHAGTVLEGFRKGGASEAV